MNLYNILTFVIFLSAVFSYLNYRFIRWPQTIGIMAIALIGSVLLVVFGSFFPVLNVLAEALKGINFNVLLLKVMLSFLLFAGGFHINAESLKKERWSVLTLAVIGTLISTFIVGMLTYYVFILFGYSIPLVYCLVFGSLISPTDPIAVLGILKDAKMPASLKLKIEGESLFNDGVAVVLFMALYEIASPQGSRFTFGDIALLFLQEAVGGIFYGL